MRKYDEKLVAAIRDKQYTQTVDGVEVLFKPVPDAQREHTIDPRLKTIIENKKKMFSGRAKVGYSLYNERNRPDKVTFDLTTVPVERTEHLIDVNSTHKINLYCYRAEGSKEGCPVLVYLHGGGFTAGNVDLFDKQMRLVAELSGAVVVFPEYRLAPECPFPGPVDDAWGAVCWVHDHAGELGADKNKIMVAGDSAGGSLTNACVLKDDSGIIKKIVVIYAAFDTSDYKTQTAYSWSYDAYEVVEEERELAYGRIDRIKNNVDREQSGESNLYLQGKTTTHDPLVSAIYATDTQLARFPRTVIVASEYDYLRVGSDYMAKKLLSLGVKVRSIRYCGCDHGFFDMLGTVVQAEELCMLLADELHSL